MMAFICSDLPWVSDYIFLACVCVVYAKGYVYLFTKHKSWAPHGRCLTVSYLYLYRAVCMYTGYVILSK
jgi:amino acid permease